jgi:guanine deaminase
VLIVRAQVIHTPRDPFAEGDGALEAFSDGAVAVGGDGRILATGDFASVVADYPDAPVADRRRSVLLPGLVDTHVHFPQLGIVGAMGLPLLDWLRERALPHELRLADTEHARTLAHDFVQALAANGTTTALVFGAHFPAAQDALFAEAERTGLRITSGLVVSDRELHPDLEVEPQAAYDASRALADRWHGRGHLRYAVTPRFALSCSEGMLDACGALAADVDHALVTSHLNEHPDEVALVAGLFGWSSDYLHTYERFGLLGTSTVLAHNVHSSDAELRRLAAAGAAVAHCPASNAFLGSGTFPLRRHVEYNVRVALGTDVGAGTGLSVLKEALLAYKIQMLRPDGVRLAPAHLLYLATSAGAQALGLGDEVGDLGAGKAADLVLISPPEGSTLAAVLRHSDSAEEVLGAVLALAREESVAEVTVEGDVVFERG